MLNHLFQPRVHVLTGATRENFILGGDARCTGASLVFQLTGLYIMPKFWYFYTVERNEFGYRVYYKQPTNDISNDRQSVCLHKEHKRECRTSDGFSATEVKATPIRTFQSDAIFTIRMIDFLSFFVS